MQIQASSPRRLPQLTSRLLRWATEGFLEISRVRHRTLPLISGAINSLGVITHKDASPCWGMGVSVDKIDRRLWPCLPAPPIRIRDEEHLLLREVLETRQELFGILFVMLLPCCECGIQTTHISDILTQSESSIDVQWLAIWVWYSEIVVLINEALGLFFESFDGLIIPPICEVSSFVVMPAGRVKGV